MRFLILCLSYPPHGGLAGIAVQSLSREFVRAGDEVLVLTQAYGVPYRISRENGVTVRRVPSLGMLDARSCSIEASVFALSAVRETLRVASRFRPQACISFSGIAALPAAYALLRYRNVPYAISLREAEEPPDGMNGRSIAIRVVRPAVGHLWRHASTVVVNTPGLKTHVQHAYPNLPVAVIPDGVVLPAAPERKTRNGGTIRLLFVGRLAYPDGLDILLKAMSLTEDAGFACRLDVVGEGDASRELVSMASELGIGDRVSFHGWTTRRVLVERLREADAFIVPSRNEVKPAAILEAMSHGLPVIGASVPGVADLVRDGHTGILVAPEDTAALARAIDRIATYPHERVELGREAFRFVEAEHTWRHSAEAYRSLFSPLKDNP